MAPSGSSGTCATDVVPEIVGTVPLMLQFPEPAPPQNLLAGTAKVELALPSLLRSRVNPTYCVPTPIFGALAWPAPGMVPCQLVPSPDVIWYCCTIGWPDAGSRAMMVENTWSDAVRPVVVAVSVRVDGDPLESTMLPFASVHAVDGLAVGGNATEKPGGATPMIA